jgi:transposase-like protein
MQPRRARQVSSTCSGPLTDAEHAELAALRRENRQLREDVEILKHATALFVQEARAPRSKSTRVDHGEALQLG